MLVNDNCVNTLTVSGVLTTHRFIVCVNAIDHNLVVSSLVFIIWTCQRSCAHKQNAVAKIFNSRWWKMCVPKTWHVLGPTNVRRAYSGYPGLTSKPSPGHIEGERVIRLPGTETRIRTHCRDKSQMRVLLKASWITNNWKGVFPSKYDRDW
jgi:hypothetical protein